MGTWGTSISSNDTYSDIYSDFFALYNDGMDVAEISKKLIFDNRETIEDKFESHNFWFALAKSQWECKKLDEEVFDRVKQIINTGADIEIWKELDGSINDIKKRITVLEKFLTDLQIEKLKPKARRKKIIRQSPFDKGDCITYKLSNGNYGGVVVLETIKDSEYPYALVAATRINQSVKPSKKDFEKADILIFQNGKSDERPIIYWYLPVKHKSVERFLERIDSIKCKKIIQ